MKKNWLWLLLILSLLPVLAGCDVPPIDPSNTPTVTAVNTPTPTAKSCPAYNDVGLPLVQETDHDGQSPECVYAIPPIQPGQTRLHLLAVSTVQKWCHLTPQSTVDACNLARFEQANYNGVVYERAVHMKMGSPVEVVIPKGMMAQIWDVDLNPYLVTGPAVLPQVVEMWVVDP